jgi:hypothetical protein
MKSKTILTIAAGMALMLVASSLMAQGPGGPPGPPGGTSGPIDGGVLSLLVGAAAYGYKQLKQQSSEQV